MPAGRWLSAAAFGRLLTDDTLHRFDDAGEAQVPVSREHLPHAVASVLVATGDGRVLLGRNKSGGWGTLGGHIDEGDGSVAAAAARELVEEARLMIDPGLLTPLSIAVDHAEFRPGCQHIDLCFALVLPWAPAVTASSDISELDWFDLDALPEMNDHMRTHVEALARHVADRTRGAP